MVTERLCSKCVYHTSGQCSAWKCNGTTTVKDIESNMLDEIIELSKDYRYVDELMDALLKLKRKGGNK